jgi:formylglycine-generating enzyme required for sulfatase activity
LVGVAIGGEKEIPKTQAPAASSQPAPVAGAGKAGPTITLDLGGGVTLEAVLIPAGKFLMGRTDYSDVVAADYPVMAKELRETGDVDLLDPLWDLDPVRTAALLREKLADGDEAANRAIIMELSRLEIDLRAVMPALVEVLRSGKAGGFRATAAGALAGMGNAAEDAVPALTAALADKEEVVRRYSAKALAAIGPKARDAIPALEKLLLDPAKPPKTSTNVRPVAQEAQTALDKIKAESGSEPNWRETASLAEVSGRGKELVLTLEKEAAVDHIVLMEDSAQRGRVRKYVLGSQVNGQWKELARGERIGRKKIVRFSPDPNPYQGIQVRSETDQVYVQGVPAAAKTFRVRVTESDGEPLMRKFAVYNTGKAWARELRRPSEWGPLGSEYPQHEVTISKAFYMGKYEVTNEQYERVMGYNPSIHREPKNPACGGGPAQLPAMKKEGRDTSQFKTGPLSWNDTQTFCRKVGELTGRTVRLPTEAEWEYAARAGGLPHVCSTAFLNRAAWWGGNSEGKTRPVGQKEPNGWGLYDMLGNVSEWTQNWPAVYTADAAVDPQGPAGPPADAPVKMIRGGYYTNGLGAYSTSRYGKPLDFSRFEIGFRVVVEVPKAP